MQRVMVSRSSVVYAPAVGEVLWLCGISIFPNNCNLHPCARNRLRLWQRQVLTWIVYVVVADNKFLTSVLYVRSFGLAILGTI